MAPQRPTHDEIIADVTAALDRHLASAVRCPGVPNTTCHLIDCRAGGCLVRRGLAWGVELQPDHIKDKP